MNNIPIIGLVGGVGSGKSTLANWIGKNRSVHVIDGDATGHKVLTIDSVKKSLRDRFGDEIFDPQSQEINRKELGQCVWGDEQDKIHARKDLQKIVHPEIRNSFLSEIKSAQTDPKLEAVFMDAAVLLESGWKETCDAIVFVETRFEDRWDRVKHNRGWTKETLEKREESQFSLEKKKELSDFSVQNYSIGTETEEETIKRAGGQLEEILNSLLNKNSAERNSAEKSSNQKSCQSQQ